MHAEKQIDHEYTSEELRKQAEDWCEQHLNTSYEDAKRDLANGLAGTAAADRILSFALLLGDNVPSPSKP